MQREWISRDGKKPVGWRVFRVIVSVVFYGIVSTSAAPSGGQSQRIESRIEATIQNGDTTEVLNELNKSIEMKPTNVGLYLARGSLLFRIGKIKESLVDFDKIIELEPNLKPDLWQRGIALYYAGEFEKGRDQFEIHRTVNPNDVENAFWHFLCAAKVIGVAEARKSILLAGFDQRAPLMEIQEMIAGKRTEKEVLDLTEKGNNPTKFYGYLYLGLYADANGHKETAVDLLQKCVALPYSGYMQDVARLHLQQMSEQKPQKKGGDSHEK